KAGSATEDGGIEMIAELTNHLWQTTVFAIVVGLLAIALRKNKARLRYALWLCASMKFLIPFSLLIGLGTQLAWTPASGSVAAKIATPSVSYTVTQITEPFPEIFIPATTAPRTPSTAAPVGFPKLLFGVGFCGFAGGM